MSIQPTFNIPTAIDMEATVLGAIMRSPIMAFDRLGGVFIPDAFFKREHKIIATALFEMFNKGQTIDMMTVCEHLMKNKKLEAAGGAYQVATLTNGVYSASNIKDHMMVVRAKFLGRQLLECVIDTQKKIISGEDSLDTLMTISQNVAKLEKDLQSISSIAHVADVNILSDIVAAHIRFPALSGITTGWADFDKVTGGWQEGDVIILGARPGMGKTSLMLKWAVVAAQHNNPVGIVTMEMSNKQLKRRLLSMNSEISVNKLKTGDLQPSDLITIEKADDEVSKLPIYIEESAYTPYAIRNTMRQMAGNGVKLVCIDYVQQMTADEANKGKNRNNEIEQFATELQKAAKEFHLAVLLLSQLSRPPKGVGIRPPSLTDLRDSGALEQVADLVIFVHREEYYRMDETDPLDSDGMPIKGKADIIIAKHRDGDTGYFQKLFKKEFALFYDEDEGKTDKGDVPFVEPIKPSPINDDKPVPF